MLLIRIIIIINIPRSFFFKSIYDINIRREYCFETQRRVNVQQSQEERERASHMCVHTRGSTTITRNQLSREPGGIRHVPAISRPQNERFNLRR